MTLNIKNSIAWNEEKQNVYQITEKKYIDSIGSTWVPSDTDRQKTMMMNVQFSFLTEKVLLNVNETNS